MKRQELQVAALRNGTVIDHIPSAKLFEVIGLLHLQEMHSSVTVGYNLKSKKMGNKSIIKVADKFFSDDEINQLSVVTPNVTLSIIRDYEVVEKKEVRMPEELIGIVEDTSQIDEFLIGMDIVLLLFLVPLIETVADDSTALVFNLCITWFVVEGLYPGIDLKGTVLYAPLHGGQIDL